MTGLHWLLLLSLFTAYLLFGGVIFMVLEQHNEILKKQELNVLRQDVQAILLDMDKEFYSNDTTTETLEAIRVAKSAVISRMSEACGGINFLELDLLEHHLKWNYYNSVFFAFTVITTIGYGHLSPTTDWSRIFVIFYALIGIPINGIVLQSLGTAFSHKLVKVQKKSKEKRYESKLVFFLDILFYLIPGMAVFIVVPAGIFVLIENWSFVDAVYYAFITLLTIGFGDFVAGAGDDRDIWMWVYKAGIIIWITFGLGYLVMILGYITKGLTHKKIRIVIENRLKTINSTRDKLTKDVDYMRRVVNELYMMKIEPVYKDGSEGSDDGCQDRPPGALERTKSEPWNIITERTGYSISMPVTPKRTSRQEHAGRHAHAHGEEGARALSESDLDRIDKRKTFDEAMKHCVMPDELLDAVVQVLNRSVVHDVLEAVDELNELEDSYGEGGASQGAEATNKGGHDVEKGPKHHLEAQWITQINTSDQDILIGDDSYTSTDTDEIVIQVDGDTTSVPSTNLVNRVNKVIRKISASSKPDAVIRKMSSQVNIVKSDDKPAAGAAGLSEVVRKVTAAGAPSGEQRSQPPSRKVSKNESDRTRKISGSRSPTRKISNLESPSKDFYHQHPELISSVHSTPTSPQLERASEHRKSTGRRIRKISHESHHHPDKKISVENTSLADFLRALDNVHHKLHHHHHEPHGSHQHSTAGATISSHHDEAPGTAGDSNNASGATSVPKNQRRARKHGVFHPGFAFENKAFDPSPEEPEDNSVKLEDEKSQATEGAPVGHVGESTA